MPEPIANGPSLEEIRAAGERLAPHIIRTPLLRFNDRFNGRDDSGGIYLKLENLQAIGAFKVRSMGNAMLAADREALLHGVYTASSGNSGLGLAWMAKQLGIPATVYAPQSAPDGKLQLVRNFGADVQLLPDREWWQIIEQSGHAPEAGYYVDAVRNMSAMAGNGTMGLEIVEQLPDVDTVIVPFGGGGVACGIASALLALKPDVRLIVAETEAAAPVTAAFNARRPVECPVTPSFISGAGAPSVLAEMWPLVSRLVRDTIVVPVAEVEAAVRMMSAYNRVVAEGAGAIPLAAALASRGSTGKTVCVVTGGNIDSSVFSRIVGGESDRPGGGRRSRFLRRS